MTTSILKFKGKKNKDGIQAYIVRINRKINGEYSTKNKIIYGKEEANAYKLKIDIELKNNSLVIDKFTVRQIFDKFIKSKRMRIRDRSVYRIIREFELYILPIFENIYIDEITPVMIENWMHELNERKKLGKNNVGVNRLLSVATKRNIFMEFKQLFGYAVKYDYVSKTPFSKVGNFRKTTTYKADFYTQDEAILFLQTARKLAMEKEMIYNDLTEWNYYVWFALAIGTGARRNEIHGFQWNDIEADTIYVREDVNKLLKTENAERRIPLSNSLIIILEEHKERMKKNDAFSQTARICNNIKNSTIERRRNKYANEVGLKIIRIHDFRHSFISHLYFANVDDDIIKEFVGHSTTEMTKLYKHLHPLQKIKAKQIVANMIL